MKKWLFILAIFLTIINVTALGTWLYNRHTMEQSCAETCCTGSGKTCGMVLHEKLELTPSQLQQLQQHQALYRQSLDSVTRELCHCRTQLGECLLAEPSEPARVQQIVQRMDSLQSVVHHKVVANLLEQKKQLTPEQQKKFFTMILQQCNVQGQSCCSN
jgi:Spy/CpxP family protein refolding chaperone